MSESESKYLGGYVFQRSSKDILLQNIFLKINKKDFSIILNTEKVGQNKDWITGFIFSYIPYKGEDKDIQPPYKYSFYFIERQDTTLSILLTENKELANKIIKEVNTLNITINPIKINTENILKNIENYEFLRFGKQEKFVVNYLYGKILGMQNKLTSIILNGKPSFKTEIILQPNHYQHLLQL